MDARAGQVPKEESSFSVKNPARPSKLASLPPGHRASNTGALGNKHGGLNYARCLACPQLPGYNIVRLAGQDRGIEVSMRKAALGKRTTNFGDARRKQHHFEVTIFYEDGERFIRMYTDETKAERFATRQKRSPVVKRTLVRCIS